MQNNPLTQEQIIEKIAGLMFSEVYHFPVKSFAAALSPFIPKWERIEDAEFEDCETMLWIRVADDTLGEPAWIGSVCDDDFVANYYTHVMKHPWCPTEKDPFQQLLNHLQNNPT